MTNSLKTHLGLALLRILTSALLLTHGIPKLQRLFSGNFDFPDPIGIGATPSFFLTTLAESICPFLIILGFKTRWAAIPPVIVMLVAALVYHSADPFGDKETPLLYLVAFVAIILLGPGKYSIDRK